MAAHAPSLLGRAVLAILLMIGFYVLALSLAGALVFLVYAEVRYMHRLDLKLAIFCLGGAGLILLSLIPRKDEFMAPGPLLTEKSFPRLFEQLHRTADRVGQSMPKEVYLVPDVNAWVSQRGGTMGVGSRRIMGIGLPLLQVLSVRELRAVLAHEFGHFHGGDTALGPWIYSTRAAIGRTLMELDEKSQLLQIPFQWYGKLFLRVTHAISRQQEYAADALAVHAEGAPAMASALQMVNRAGTIFPFYWNGEVAAVLGAGFRPPIAAGFSEFMGVVKQKQLLNEESMQKAAEAENPYDTHPPLARRLDALAKAKPGQLEEQQAADLLPAIRLMGDADALESELLAALDRRPAGFQQRKLTPIAWSEVGDRVYVPMWKDAVKRSAVVLSQTKFRDLNGEFIRSVSTRLAAGTGNAPWHDQVQAQALVALEGSVFLALIEQGWTLKVDLAQPNLMTRESKEIEPAGKLRGLAEGKLAPADWIAWCDEVGIADAGLVPPAWRVTVP